MSEDGHVHTFRDKKKEHRKKEFKVRISKVWLTAYNSLGLLAV